MKSFYFKCCFFFAELLFMFFVYYKYVNKKQNKIVNLINEEHWKTLPTS